MARYVALLRGINVGRNKRIAMAELRALLDDLGYTDVRTHLQSGNAVFATTNRSPERVRGEMERAISERFGMDVSVLVRNRKELAAVVAANTLPCTDGAKLQVAFLDQALPADATADLDPDGYLPERFQVGTREFYLWCANGVQDSKVAKVFSEKRMQRTITARNWNTVTALLNLMPDGD